MTNRFHLLLEGATSEGTPYIKALAREGLTMDDAKRLAEALPSASPVRYTLRQWDDVANNWRVVGSGCARP